MASKQCLETYTNKLAHVREHRNQLNYVSLLIHADKLAWQTYSQMDIQKYRHIHRQTDIHTDSFSALYTCSRYGIVNSYNTSMRFVSDL